MVVAVVVVLLLVVSHLREMEKLQKCRNFEHFGTQYNFFFPFGFTISAIDVTIKIPHDV